MGRTSFEDSGTDRREILKMDIKVIGFQEVDWIHLAQNKVQLQAQVSTVVNFQATSTMENFMPM